MRRDRFVSMKWLSKPKFPGMKRERFLEFVAASWGCAHSGGFGRREM
jgi:hypothetical protein